MIGLRLLLAVVAALLAIAPAAPATAAAPSPTKGVVIIETNLALQNAAAAGTGIVLTKTGEVLTNNHVIRGATTIRVSVPATSRTYSATVLGYDIVDDIALLKLSGASNLATATFGNSSSVKVGQPARAVGNANGGHALVTTTGKITALNQTISVQDDFGGVAQLRSLIQTSARLVPGDSGGPLLDGAGRVVGVDAAGSPSFGLQSSTGFAIPINRARAIAKQIEANRSSATVHVGATAFIGVTVTTASNGVVVGSVVPDSPAASAGLAPGDVLTALDGRPLAAPSDVRSLLFSKHPGDTVTLAYVDAAGTAQTVSVVLAPGPPQ